MNGPEATNRGRLPLAIILYLLGLLLMLTVSILTMLPEMEVTMFDRPLITEDTLPALHCPLAVTPSENAAITATFTNDQERALSFRAQARIAFRSTAVMEEIDHWVELAPGETKVVRWSLDTESAAYGRMILARVHVSRRGSIPPQQRGCGLLVLDLPFFTGTQYVLGMAFAGFLAVAVGGYLWLDGKHPAQGWQEQRTRRLMLLPVPLAGAMVAGLFNLWVPGGLLLVLALLLLLSFAQ